MIYFKSFAALLLIVSMSTGCNKESIIEGQTNAITIVEVGKTFQMSPSTSNGFVFQVAEFSLQNTMVTLASKGTVSQAFAATDSTRITYLYFQSGVQLSQVNNSLIKYGFGDVIPLTGFSISSSPFYLQASKKPSPYTTAYVAINSSFLYSGLTIQPQFSINQDAYIGFRLPVSSSNSYFYGWIHVIIGVNTIKIDNIGYVFNKGIKAGER